MPLWKVGERNITRGPSSRAKVWNSTPNQWCAEV